MIDAVLAMMLTLAALATVATILMECGLRFTRMRKKNLVKVVELMLEDIDQGPIILEARDKSKLILDILKNPAIQADSKTQSLAASSQPEALMAYLGPPAGLLSRVLQFFPQLFSIDRRDALYDKVSTEHVLRKLAGLDSIRNSVVQAGVEIETEFNRLATRFEEFSSAVSAQYKRNAKAWSMFVGLLVAFIFNVDGMRVFDAYLKDNALAASIIAEQQELEAQGEDAVAQLQAFHDAVEALAVAQESGNAEALEAARNTLEALGDPDAILQRYKDATSTVDTLVGLGLPIGMTYYPYCSRENSEEVTGDGATATATQEGESAQAPVPEAHMDPKCNAPDSIGSRLGWFTATLLTGLLIGLGAPFWFDMAKRLGSLRSGIKELAPREERLAARSSNGDPEERQKIVSSVVADARARSTDVGLRGEIARKAADKARARPQ